MDSGKRDFDKEAATWDTPPRVKLAGDVSKAMLGRLQLTKEMDVLDFGCGTGLVTLPFNTLVHSITGVDSSKGMLDVFESKARKQRVDNVKTRYLDLTKGDVVGDHYHAVVSSMTLHHVKDTQKLLEHFYGALLPGGQIAIADLDEEGGSFHDNNDGVFHLGFNREKLGRLFAEIGFTDVQFTTAAQMKKTGADGKDRVFDVFLVTGLKG